MSDNNYTSMDSSVISTRFKVVVVGDVSVGKTSFISQLIDNKFSKIKKTLKNYEKES